MDRVNDRTYVGRPGEPVTVATRTSGGGQASVIVDGVDMGPGAQFSLPVPGGRRDWEVALIGPLGARCRVETRVVNGEADIDLLMCQTHNPAPVSFYTASAAVEAAPRSVRTRGARRTAVSTPQSAKARAAARRATAKKTTRTRKKGVKQTTTGTAASKTPRKTSRKSTSRTTKRGRS